MCTFLLVAAALALLILDCSEIDTSPIHDLLLWWTNMVKWLTEMWKPSTFTRFSQLPCEIRLMIWEAAVPDRPVDQNSV